MNTTQSDRCKIGIILPEGENDMAGDTARWRDYQAMAHMAEQIGLDSIWFVDPLIYRKGRVWECWTMLTGLAAITERVELGSLVTPTSFRNPAVFAKQIDAIEEISDGRVILGLGAGWNEPEYTAFGRVRVSHGSDVCGLVR